MVNATKREAFLPGSVKLTSKPPRSCRLMPQVALDEASSPNARSVAATPITDSAYRGIPRRCARMALTKSFLHGDARTLVDLLAERVVLVSDAYALDADGGHCPCS